MADLIEQRRIEGFQQLHRELREYGRRCLYGINIFHIRHSLDFTLPDLPEELQFRYHGIGCLSLPDFDPASDDFRIATAENEPAASAHDAGSKFVQGHWETFNVGSGIANVSKDHQIAAGDFRLLCERAGALVSHSHLAALPFSQIKYGYKNWANAGRFLAVMFWAKPLSASEVKQLACHGWVCWTQDPFNFAADTIERCGLASDSPQMIPHDVEWPAWAGDRPSGCLIQKITDPISPAHSEVNDEVQSVTIDQMAAICNCSKKTIERWLYKGMLPRPDYEGGGGKKHKWCWSEVRESLENASGMKFKERFPTLKKPPRKH